jgi:Tol biopolymer transport system component
MWIGIAAVAVLSMVALPAADVKAEVELRAAVEQETVKGDLKGAIERYKRIIAAYPQNRSVTARALLHIGSSYEKLGQADAQKAYERLVREYSDQKEVAAQAQTRLASLGGGQRGPAAMTMRRLSAGQEPDNEGQPSPDGQWLSYTSPEGDLAIYNLLTGEKRVLKRNTPDQSGRRGWVQESIWSPDGKQIAYGWTYCDKPSGCVELRVMQTDGSGDRGLYRNDKVAYVYPWDWSPDGKYISTTLEGPERGVALVDARTGEARVLKSFPREQAPGKVLFSPDGRYLAFDIAQPDRPNRDVWLMSLDGSQIPVAQHPADDRMVAWLPDGVLFASDRTGTMDIWMQPVANGKPQGPPERLRAGIGNLEYTLGLTRSGSLYYSVRTAVNDVFIAELDPATGKAVSRGVSVSQRYAGRYGYAVWSPDGGRLAAVATDKQQSGWGPGPFPIIVLHDMASGEERNLKHSVPELRSLSWSPDGQSLVASGLYGDKRWGIYKVDPRTGEAAPLVTSEITIFNPQLSPDGGTLYYQESAPGGFTILALDLKSGNKRVAVNTGQELDYHLNGWFALSPDGDRVAYVAGNGSKNRLLVAPAKGGEARLLHENKFELLRRFLGVAWSPDGRYVLFVERPDVKSAFELWRLPAQGGQPEKLGLAAEGLYAPRVHPDGTRIAYSAGSAHIDSEIWVLENFLPTASGAATAKR